jgi:hypothetical protein
MWQKLIGETGRPLAVLYLQNSHKLKQGFLEKSKLAQHAYEEDHRAGCDEDRV